MSRYLSAVGSNIAGCGISFELHLPLSSFIEIVGGESMELSRSRERGSSRFLNQSCGFHAGFFLFASLGEFLLVYKVISVGGDAADISRGA